MSNRSIERHLQAIEKSIFKLGELMAVQQSDLDALTTALTADDAAILSEITALQQANPNLDLTALTAAVAATAALVPASA
jgi:cob(I)alamin adenosyltransferase